MIDALIGGKLYGQPQQRQGHNGKTFTTAKLRAATNADEAIFVSVIAFAPDAQAALLALGDGESVAVSGELTPKVWANREGQTKPALDLVAHAVITPYHVTRKRKAIHGRE